MEEVAGRAAGSQTSAERMQALRARKRAAGFIQTSRWIYDRERGQTTAVLEWLEEIPADTLEHWIVWRRAMDALLNAMYDALDSLSYRQERHFHLIETALAVFMGELFPGDPEDDTSESMG